jgi:aryl-alcohol dehydrogenase-like predicted oxidoreductase
MASRNLSSYSRRELLKRGVLLGAGAALTRADLAIAATNMPLIEKAIPSSGEKIPVVGLGTNNYSVSSVEEIATRREVVKRMAELGGKVIDTAPGYGRSETVIGEIVGTLGNRKQLFLATKVVASGSDLQPSKASVEESFRRLGTDVIDLMQVHNLQGVDALMPLLSELKASRKIRYIGVTSSRTTQHEQMVDLMRRHRFDFIQVNYSIEDRDAANKILPLAQDKGVAALLNVPFGGRRGDGNVLKKVSGRPLPDWAVEIDARSWAQLVLKYGVSHPAVVCAIPGTTDLKHIEDNLQAARGRLPDAAMRKRLEQYWDSMA